MSVEGSCDERDGLVARWLDLTRRVLPGMATARNWPVRQDHCFMRVLLDGAVGVRWDTVIRRPAIRHAGHDVLRRALALGEELVRRPDRLPALNRASLRMRGH